MITNKINNKVIFLKMFICLLASDLRNKDMQGHLKDKLIFRKPEIYSEIKVRMSAGCRETRM